MIYRLGWLLVCLSLAAGVALAQNPAPIITRTAPPDPNLVQFQTVASGFRRPLLATNAGDSSGRLFVVEQGGVIHVVENGRVLDRPFLDVSALLHRDVHLGGFTERGLLGLAFHPDYERNGLFYINYNDVSGQTVVAQYRVAADDPNVADPNSAIIVFTQQQPAANHNGGHLAFGPDGYLYIGLGDGGPWNDPRGDGQNPGTRLGAILRIAVHEDGTYSIPPDNPVHRDARFAPEVWAYGLRNPWRFSFDAATGDLYIADVGQSRWEEVNFEPADSPGGVNYGWSMYEGTHPFHGGTPTADMVFPFFEYDHSQGISVTGGHVYRGAALPDLQGVYLFGDWGYGTIWASYRDEAGQWQTSVFRRTRLTISSFGVDEENELYAVDYNGSVLKFAPVE